MDTVIFHIDAITGQDLVDGRDPTAPLQGYELIQGALVNAYLLNALDTRIVIALDEFLQVMQTRFLSRLKLNSSRSISILITQLLATCSPS